MDPSPKCPLKEADNSCYAQLYYDFAYLEEKLVPDDGRRGTSVSGSRFSRSSRKSKKGYLESLVSFFRI